MAVLIVLCNSVLSQEKITYMLTIVKKVRLISDCAPVCSVHLSVSITQVEIIYTSTEKMANERIFFYRSHRIVCGFAIDRVQLFSLL